MLIASAGSFFSCEMGASAYCPWSLWITWSIFNAHYWSVADAIMKEKKLPCGRANIHGIIHGSFSCQLHWSSFVHSAIKSSFSVLPWSFGWKYWGNNISDTWIPEMETIVWDFVNFNGQIQIDNVIRIPWSIIQWSIQDCPTNGTVGFLARTRVELECWPLIQLWQRTILDSAPWLFRQWWL